MRILQPNVDIIYQQNDENAHIAKCARICYASDKTGNNDEFVKRLNEHGHKSMFRHAGVYYIIPENHIKELPYDPTVYCNPLLCNIAKVDGTLYISTNRQYAKEYLTDMQYFEISWQDAYDNEIFIKHQLLYFSIVVETGVDIIRELNRVSPNAIAERSTRYVDFNKKIGIVYKQCSWMNSLNWYKKALVNIIAKFGEWFYKISRSKYGLNLNPEDARWCLYLDFMSNAVYTYPVKVWEAIINHRMWGFTGKPHPDAQRIANMIYNILKSTNHAPINKY